MTIDGPYEQLKHEALLINIINDWCVDGSEYCNTEPLKDADQHELDLNTESVPRSKHSPSR